jgi:hypothetical protein
MASSLTARSVKEADEKEFIMLEVANGLVSFSKCVAVNQQNPKPMPVT